MDGAELEVDYSLFEQNIWPVIAHRVPAFESLKVSIYYIDDLAFDMTFEIGECMSGTVPPPPPPPP